LARMLSKQQRLEQRLEDFSRASSKRDILKGHFKWTFQTDILNEERFKKSRMFSSNT
jgi:hypothetical protein